MCIYVTGGDVSYLCLNKLYIFDCSVRTERLSLDCWPTLSIIVQYGELPDLDPTAPEDEEAIVAALKQSDRVSYISLTITSSLLEKLFAIERPFSELEDLVLLSRERVSFPVGPTPPLSPLNWDRLSRTPSASFFFRGSCRPSASRNRSFAYLTRSAHEYLIRDDPASITQQWTGLRMAVMGSSSTIFCSTGMGEEILT